MALWIAARILGERCASAGRRRRIGWPKAKTRVAKSTSHGTSRAKEEGRRGGEQQQRAGGTAGEADGDKGGERQARHAAGGAPPRPANGDLSGKERDGRGDVRGARIEAGEEQSGKGDEGAPAGKGVLHPGPESGGAKQKKDHAPARVEGLRLLGNYSRREVAISPAAARRSCSPAPPAPDRGCGAGEGDFLPSV